MTDNNTEKTKIARLNGRELYQFVRYYAVAALNTAFGYGIFAAFIALGVNIFVAQILGRIIGTTFNYFTYGKLVFRSYHFSLRRFILAYIGNYLVALALLAVAVKVIANPYVAGFSAMLTASLINFVVLRLWVSRKKDGEDYTPYPINWAFLPEWMLLVKDTVRHFIFWVIEGAMSVGWVRSLWKMLIGRRIADSIQKADRLFIHIPKNGGTSVAKILYGRNLPHFSKSFYDSMLGDEIEGCESFAVLRDPVDRFLSAFRFMASGGTDVILVSRFEQKRLKYLHSLPQFVDFLTDEPERMAIALPFMPQTYFTMKDGEVAVDRLFAQDRNGQFPQEMVDWLGVEQVPYVNKTKAKAPRLDPKLREKIRALYADDVKLYEAVLAQGRAIDFEKDDVPRAILKLAA